MPQKYTVQPGDSLTSIIAELCNKTPEQVAREGLDKLNARLNELPNANAIQVGQRLTIYCQDPNEDDEGPGERPEGPERPEHPEQPGEPDDPGSAPPEESAGAACLRRCWERYLVRIQACAGQSDAEVKRACLEGARDVLQACLRLCEAHAGAGESREEDTPESDDDEQHGLAPPPPGCRDQAARMVGIDVSHHQGDIDFQQVAGDASCFVYIKATEGATHSDPKAETYARDARQAGLLVGYYHFARPKAGDAEAEARAFLARLAALPQADLVPALDLEAFEREHTLEDADLTRWTATWLEAVRQAHGGKKPLLYVNRSWGNKMTPATTPVAGYPLWLASYVGGEAPAPPGNQPTLPTLWSTYSLWQYTRSGRVRGIRGAVDMNLAPRGIAHLKLR